MPVNWKAPDAFERLLAAMVAAQDMKLDYRKIATYYGQNATYDSIEGRFRIIKREAAALKAEIESGARPGAPARHQNNGNGNVNSSASSFSGSGAGTVATPKKKTTKGAGGTPKSAGGAASAKGRERTVGGRVGKSGAGSGDASPTVSVPGTPSRAGRGVGMGRVKAEAVVVAGPGTGSGAGVSGIGIYGGGSTEKDDDDDGEDVAMAGGGTSMGGGMGVNPYMSMYGGSDGADNLFSANATGGGSGFNAGVLWDPQGMMGEDGMVPMTRGGMNLDGAFDGPDIGV